MAVPGQNRVNGRPLDVAIVCALACEARPLLRALDLEQAESRGLRRNRSVGLLVSGVGAERAAAAVGILAADADGSTCWLNVGCAGGRGPIGELLAAHKVSDAGGEAWYPQFPFPVGLPTAEVRTVARPETGYPETRNAGPALYEMEAAGFYRAALERSTLERVQVLKLRVDGPEHPIERLTADSIEAQVGERLPEVLTWIDRLREVARSVRARRPDRRQVDAFVERWRFTASQRVQLQRALERMHALSIPPPEPSSLRAGGAGEVVDALREIVAAHGSFA